MIIASLYSSFDNLSIHIAIQENEGHYVSTQQVARKCKIQKKSHIDSKEPMTRKYVKMPILGQIIKNNNCLFYSEEMLYGEL